MHAAMNDIVFCSMWSFVNIVGICCRFMFQQLDMNRCAPVAAVCKFKHSPWICKKFSCTAIPSCKSSMHKKESDAFHSLFIPFSYFPILPPDSLHISCHPLGHLKLKKISGRPRPLRQNREATSLNLEHSESQRQRSTWAYLNKNKSCANQTCDYLKLLKQCWWWSWPT